MWEKSGPDGDSEIEATEFLVVDVDPIAILQQMTHVFELRMRHRGIGGRPVRIRVLSDLPSKHGRPFWLTRRPGLLPESDPQRLAIGRNGAERLLGRRGEMARARMQGWS